MGMNTRLYQTHRLPTPSREPPRSHAAQHPTARLHAIDRAAFQRQAVAGQLRHRHDQTKGRIWKRQGLGGGLYGDPAMLDQPKQGGAADLDEVRTGDGQARPQARSDLQAAGTGGVQFADQRSG